MLRYVYDDVYSIAERREEEYISQHFLLFSTIDYTDDPDENLLPGDVNMEKLKTMYLSRRRLRKRVVQEDGSIIETIEVMANEMDSAVNDAEEVILEDENNARY